MLARYNKILWVLLVNHDLLLQNVDLLYRRTRGISALFFAFSFSSHACRLTFVFERVGTVFAVFNPVGSTTGQRVPVDPASARDL